MRLLAILLLGVSAFSQAPKKLTPAKWALEFTPSEAKPGGTAIAKLTATIEEPWHMYSPTTPPGGPMITKIVLADTAVAESLEIYRPKPVRKLDPNFGIEAETYDKEAVFFLKLKLKGDAPAMPAEVQVNMRYQVCTEKECLPQRANAKATLRLSATAAETTFTVPEGYALVPAAAAKPAAAAVPVAAPEKKQESLLGFAAVAFGLGLAAVFTPCVFPMIPFTVSAFIRNRSVLQAAVYAGGIVLFFTSLGLLVTALVGPFGVVQLGSNPWVNGVIAVVFLAFSFSLLGAFEITLPSSLLTKMDQASQSRGGIAGALLMGLTFALTSFACVGPFMGSLLAASVQGDKLQPAIGMAAFSSGLASPFFFLALFPSTLSKMPRSGGWLPRVKTVLGFVLLAVSLKYVSNVDVVLQWNLLTRERFLAAWVVLFSLPGLYLLGFLRMEGVKPEEQVGSARAAMGALFLVFAVSLIPGMFGGKLGDLDAYVPLASESSLGAQSGGGEKQAWMKNQYKEALARAKAENKLLLVNFTGYACTNCHWMKANMFPRPAVAAELKNHVLLELYTDGTDTESEKNQELQNAKFATIAIPYYVLIDGEEKVVAAFPGLTKDTAEFVAFLQKRG
ncbi:MAG: thioredoxin family protein [Bryobacterales bacterium]|nr:thioredoxin family protein [Bryobacterales bacterium]